MASGEGVAGIVAGMSGLGAAGIFALVNTVAMHTGPLEAATESGAGAIQTAASAGDAAPVLVNAATAEMVAVTASPIEVMGQAPDEALIVAVLVEGAAADQEAELTSLLFEEPAAQATPSEADALAARILAGQDPAAAPAAGDVQPAVSEQPAASEGATAAPAQADAQPAETLAAAAEPASA